MRARVGVLAGVVVALAASGCGSVAAQQVEATNESNGERLFVERCGSCHVLAAAGTAGRVGPDLDEALDDVREHGFDESTIRDMVRGQIAYPVEDPPTEAPGMPADLVTGQDAADVAAYVASVAGKPVEAAPGQTEPGAGEAALEPKELFVQQCGTCHILADAGTEGTIGPNLDESQPQLEPAIEQIANGGGGMPAFGDQLTDDQIRALAEYIVRATQGG